MQTSKNSLKVSTIVPKIMTTLAILAALSPMKALAQAPTAPAPAANANGKLDVTDLEKKYWAAKDSDFNVVQNRLFTKAGRFSLGVQYGTIFNETWADSPTLGASLGYYFSERWGVEAVYNNTSSKDNKDTDRLKSQSGYPNHNLVKGFYGLQANYVPFYAKMSFLNSSIVYFDMGLSLGVGMTQYDQLKEEGNVSQSAPTVSIGLNQTFYLNKWLAIRADYINRFYNEERVWYRASSVPAGSGRVDTTDLKNSQMLMLGVTLYY